MARVMRRLVKKLLPGVVKRWLRSVRRHYFCRPPVGRVNFGSLRSLQPISKTFGFERGLPVDRYYIERFLQRHTSDIRGHILEIGDDTYTKRFAGDKVTGSDVLHLNRQNQHATIVADLTCADNIDSNTFDCIICTQTLQFIYDVRAALGHLHRILKPKGVLLVTVTGISQMSRYDMDRWGDYWRFTTLSAKRLFEEAFLLENVEVKAYGNVISAISLLHGLASEELNQEELDYLDPDYEVVIAVRAVKGRNEK